MKFLALIPAREGSKGLPGKHLLKINGQSLLSFTANAAKEAGLSCYLSTDGEAIAAEGRKLGLKVPFIRPKSLAADNTPVIEVVKHFLDYLSQANENLDALVLLQATSPLRTSAHIISAMELFKKSKADSLVSVVRVPHRYLPSLQMTIDKENFLIPVNDQKISTQRQDKPIQYSRNGPAILITRSEVLKSGRLYGDKNLAFEMSQEESVDIDTSEDFRLAEFYLGPRQ